MSLREKLKLPVRKPRREKKPQGPKKTVEQTMSTRILVLSGIILVCFGVLLCRLVYLQAFEHEAYLEKQDDYTSIRQYTVPPRGQIYDAKGNIIAKTVVSHNIVYTSPNNLSISDYLLYADRLGTVFDVNMDDFTEWERKDAYLTYCGLLESDDPKYNALYLLDDKDRQDYLSGAWGAEASSKLYSLQMQNLDLDEVNENLSEEDQKTYALYNRMLSNAATGQESVILEDVSDTDVAYLVEHKTDFPGFDIDFGGWKREYPYGESLSDVIGTVSTSTQGLPQEYADFYQSKGYQLNAQVGMSGLELEYNDLLSGTEEIAKITYDSNGLAHKEIIQEAQKGHDLVLSVDMDLQQTLDSVLKQTLASNAGTTNREAFNSLFMCMMDPQNGEVIALSGWQRDPKTGKLSYYASGNYKSLINPGSCVKGATVYMGESEGVITGDEWINDVRMNIGGMDIGSYANHGMVNDIAALSVSSNVYMFQVAIRLGGDQYVEGSPLHIQDPKKTLELMRNYYTSFGLGNATGLDVPDESSAYLGSSELPGMLLNYAIGQYDMYTPMQMLQYVSVIAADGKMYQPRFYQYSNEVNGDQVYDINGPVLKSELPKENQQYLERVQEGFRACVVDGNCYNGIADVGYDMAAKTGTAEVEEWTTSNLVGYGPYEDPTVAFACSAPLSSVNTQDVGLNLCASEVVQPVLSKYFELYPPEEENKDRVRHADALKNDQPADEAAAQENPEDVSDEPVE